MKILTVVGARPQFIKAAAVSRVLRERFTEVLVHTGQHYDQNMSDIFFDELSIPKPDYNLGVGSGSHARQTAEMLVKVEEVLLKEQPDMLLVYGDTNSTLAAALAASKIHIPVVHIEAGLRSFNMRMPEEQNRILTDRISSYLFCPTKTAVTNLAYEGVKLNVFDVGDVMCDAVIYYSKEMEKRLPKFFYERLEFEFEEMSFDKWYLATIHRAENTDNIDKISNILSAFEKLNYKVLFPVHPRTRGMVKQLCDTHKYKNIVFVKPMGYLDMLYFTKNAEKIVTDSGGLQKEAFILGTDCVTVRDQTEWVETLIGGFNILCRPTEEDILSKVNNHSSYGTRQNYYGDGHAAMKITDTLWEKKI